MGWIVPGPLANDISIFEIATVMGLSINALQTRKSYDSKYGVDGFMGVLRRFDLFYSTYILTYLSTLGTSIL